MKWIRLTLNYGLHFLFCLLVFVLLIQSWMSPYLWIQEDYPAIMEAQQILDSDSTDSASFMTHALMASSGFGWAELGNSAERFSIVERLTARACELAPQNPNTWRLRATLLTKPFILRIHGAEDLPNYLSQIEVCRQHDPDNSLYDLQLATIRSRFVPVPDLPGELVTSPFDPDPRWQEIQDLFHRAQVTNHLRLAELPPAQVLQFIEQHHLLISGTGLLDSVSELPRFYLHTTLNMQEAMSQGNSDTLRKYWLQRRMGMHFGHDMLPGHLHPSMRIPAEWSKHPLWPDLVGQFRQYLPIAPTLYSVSIRKPQVPQPRHFSEILPSLKRDPLIRNTVGMLLLSIILQVIGMSSKANIPLKAFDTYFCWIFAGVATAYLFYFDVERSPGGLARPEGLLLVGTMVVPLAGYYLLWLRGSFQFQVSQLMTSVAILAGSLFLLRIVSEWLNRLPPDWSLVDNIPFTENSKVLYIFAGLPEFQSTRNFFGYYGPVWWIFITWAMFLAAALYDRWQNKREEKLWQYLAGSCRFVAYRFCQIALLLANILLVVAICFLVYWDMAYAQATWPDRFPQLAAAQRQKEWEVAYVKWKTQVRNWKISR